MSTRIRVGIEFSYHARDPSRMKLLCDGTAKISMPVVGLIIVLERSVFGEGPTGVTFSRYEQ